MLAAHVLAIVAGATLIAAGERLWRALSRAVRAVVRIVCAVAARPVLSRAEPISRCALHYCLPLRCRIGVRRSASPADRHPNDTRKPTNEIHYWGASRALIAVAVTGATVSIGLLTGTASASAHVRAESDNAAPGQTAVVTFRVPGESEKGALTTQLKVELPDVASARTEVMPGWTARLDRNVEAGTAPP